MKLSTILLTVFLVLTVLNTAFAKSVQVQSQGVSSVTSPGKPGLKNGRTAHGIRPEVLAACNDGTKCRNKDTGMLSASCVAKCMNDLEKKSG